MIAVSIVSHGHGEMVSRLITQLLGFPEVKKIILTKNIPELIDLPTSSKLSVIENNEVAGFGANHNLAFNLVREDFFCILNPDVIFLENPFATLLMQFRDRSVNLVAPLVKDVIGNIEDSIRFFPTPLSIVKKLMWGEQSRYELTQFSQAFSPEWVAGMFMLFKTRAFAELQGFDEGFYLYYEDVDICTRIWQSGGAILAVPQTQVIHDAQRASRNNFKHLKWHLSSMTRYFLKHLWRLPKAVG